MRNLKMSGVSMIAVMATMGVCASLAHAEGSTALCKVEELPCPEKTLYGKGTIIKALAGKQLTLFLTETNAWSCDHASLEIELMQALGNPLEARILQYKFAECKSECTVVSEVPESALFLRELELIVSETEELRITLTCPSIGKCVLVATPFILGIFSTSFEAAKIWVNKVLFKRENFNPLCAKLWEMDSILEITSPEPLFVSS